MTKDNRTECTTVYEMKAHESAAVIVLLILGLYYKRQQTVTYSQTMMC